MKSINEAISIERLKTYRRLQMKHDEIYHHEILVLGVARRMNHVALHLVKYLNVFVSLPASSLQNRKAFVDAFIMIVSASNLLAVSLNEETIISRINGFDKSFTDHYIQLLSQLAKACEATDHQEDYPIRLIWNTTIEELFCLLICESKVRGVSLLEEAAQRLDFVEKEHSLNDILRGEE